MSGVMLKSGQRCWQRLVRLAGTTTLYIQIENDGTLIGYLETPSLAAAKAGMEKTEINAKWQAEMAEFFVALEGKRPDEGFLQLEEVFHLNQ